MLDLLRRFAMPTGCAVPRRGELRVRCAGLNHSHGTTPGDPSAEIIFSTVGGVPWETKEAKASVTYRQAPASTSSHTSTGGVCPSTDALRTSSGRSCRVRFTLQAGLGGSISVAVFGGSGP